MVHILQKEGAEVLAWEPFKPDANLEGITMSLALENAIKDADAIVVLVKHTEFTKLDPSVIAQQTKARTLIDTVNCWESEAWKSHGFTVYRIGDGKTKS